jgi:hypothetical protein
MNFNNCNNCTTTCGINSAIDEARSESARLGRIIMAKCKGHRPHRGTWKLGLLALAHPTSLNAALSQFPWAKAILSISLK